MRVLTFTGLFPNEGDPEHGIFVYQRMAHLAQRGQNLVEVVAPVPFCPKWLPIARWKKVSQLPSTERVGILTVHHPRYFLLPKVSMLLHGVLVYWGSLRLARRLHMSRRFDWIDAHFVYPDGLAAVLLGRKLRLPVVVTARGTDINSYPSLALIRPLIRWTLRHASVRVAVSAALRDKMAEVGGRDLAIHVIPNGVDPERFGPVLETQARQQLGLPNAGQIIVAVGSLLERKGITSLFEQCKSLLNAIRGFNSTY